MKEALQHRLSPYRDADELLEALHSIEVVDPGLRGALTVLLEHDDPDVRAETVRILVRRWKDEAARPWAFRLLKDDPVEEVREASAYAIAGSSTPPTREYDTRHLLAIVRDPRETPRVRAAAYDSLLIVHRRSQFPTKKREFDPVEDMDHEWLDSLD